jgi:hypothetical protein
MQKNLTILLAILLIFGGLLRIYHIEFGLPHSFYADEPEFSELAIKYTYEIRDILKNGDYYKLIPISYVYGTLPTYILTLLVMGFSKMSNLFNIPFDKTTLFIFQRVITALTSTFLIFIGAHLYKATINNKSWFGFATTAGLLALNWKLIVHAHYVNADIFLSLFIALSIYYLAKYLEKEISTGQLVLSALFFGAAAGTKITAMITFPLHLALILWKKDYRGAIAYGFIVFGIFALTNPFSVIFAQDFAYRVFTLSSKEAGLVFDSVDLSVTKYIEALIFMATPVFFITSLYGMYTALKERVNGNKNVLLMGTILIYLLFFTFQSRRIDRWLLPILPLILVYTAAGLEKLKTEFKFRKVLLTVVIAGGFQYAFYIGLLLSQFQRNTPKSEAYLWAKENLPATSTKLAYTEEGLDPLNKLPYSRVRKFEVYASENAQFFMPEEPYLYDYVIISSRPMENFKKPEVKKQYPFYYARWKSFEETLQDTSKFELVKDFTVSKPNLIPLSDVFIYKRITGNL